MWQLKMVVDRGKVLKHIDIPNGQHQEEKNIFFVKFHGPLLLVTPYINSITLRAGCSGMILILICIKDGQFTFTDKASNNGRSQGKVKAAKDLGQL